MRIIETVADLERGVNVLSDREPRFAELVAITGPPPLRRNEGGFRGLLSIVNGQQLSRASASAIWMRMEAQLSPLTPEHLNGLDDDTLRAAGASRPKVKTIRALCDAFISGACEAAALEELSDAQVHDVLVSIKGVGRWTADLYLLSCLGRPDVWPVGDLALRIAAQKAFALDERPDAPAMTDLAEPWRPWRAVAARILWSYYAAIKGGPA